MHRNTTTDVSLQAAREPRPWPCADEFELCRRACPTLSSRQSEGRCCPNCRRHVRVIVARPRPSHVPGFAGCSSDQVCAVVGGIFTVAGLLDSVRGLELERHGS